MFHLESTSKEVLRMVKKLQNIVKFSEVFNECSKVREEREKSKEYNKAKNGIS